MIEWFSQNSDTLNAIASVGVLAVWAVYLHTFLQSFHRQTRPEIVINRAAGSDLDAWCFVSNMSPEAIYIESIIVTVSIDGKAGRGPSRTFRTRSKG